MMSMRKMAGFFVVVAVLAVILVLPFAEVLDPATEQMAARGLIEAVGLQAA